MFPNYIWIVFDLILAWSQWELPKFQISSRCMYLITKEHFLIRQQRAINLENRNITYYFQGRVGIYHLLLGS